MSDVICHNCGKRYDCELHEEQGLCKRCSTGRCQECIDKILEKGERDMEKVVLKVEFDVVEESKHNDWERILKEYVKEAIEEYVGCQSEEHPDELVEIENVSVEKIETANPIKWGIKIDGVEQPCHFYFEEDANDFSKRYEIFEGIQPELIEVFLIL